MKIFLCSPYTHYNPIVREKRVEKINKKVAELMNAGHIVFSPISHSHYIAEQENLPLTFDFWQKQNHSFIDWCEAVFVLKLPNWEKSKGIADEIFYAKFKNKIIKYIEE